MNYIKNFKIKLGLIGELIAFLWSQKLWWMIPMVLVLVVFGLFLIFAQGTSFVHFIYPLF
ncbi:hypothetical protein A2715_02625 [Candidatus Woesebacteria bacterium RIFCSPHIGHO2_01_FULL_39_32]|uniref:Uncharacterized protein n=1 Tax=Candidatus Woesebacteria bacterium RIFCSPLOWO2_01_FULL_39_25 TaxID=1802521 RepID=A0A1F8BJZ7_9BACT|nr:MAG: hypothetical protein A2124_01240 [Candidatus Woesebacteria bacterium GWB1_37_5]OGM24048.1 MAG: hypothetical protein A2715_02625 [Candidatus Woesebacteria bacterium RIFCSPHIGHO2_01_FULL_39_32]OGM38047.1 MAG: hypothetical protein A3F01_05940 [Candidatus Woesebacteria bacterium RIFCSPHIGHO2_12_FULL_38_11]OGM64391.1 MAG: hypothetical protein A2893_00800 [Candidatus Woesebacteria bacterium RIFCSPLOWO2_01_FULL_39_25]